MRNGERLGCKAALHVMILLQTYFLDRDYSPEAVETACSYITELVSAKFDDLTAVTADCVRQYAYTADRLLHDHFPMCQKTKQVVQRILNSNPSSGENLLLVMIQAAIDKAVLWSEVTQCVDALPAKSVAQALNCAVKSRNDKIYGALCTIAFKSNYNEYWGIRSFLEDLIEDHVESTSATTTRFIEIIVFAGWIEGVAEDVVGGVPKKPFFELVEERFEKVSFENWPGKKEVFLRLVQDCGSGGLDLIGALRRSNDEKSRCLGELFFQASNKKNSPSQIMSCLHQIQEQFPKMGPFLVQKLFNELYFQVDYSSNIRRLPPSLKSISTMKGALYGIVDNALIAFDLHAGRLLWTKARPFPISGATICSRGLSILSSDRKYLKLLKLADGRMSPNYCLPDSVRGVPIEKAEILVTDKCTCFLIASTKRGIAIFVGLLTDKRWTTKFEISQLVHRAKIAGEQLLVCYGDQMILINEVGAKQTLPLPKVVDFVSEMGYFIFKN